MLHTKFLKILVFLGLTASLPAFGQFTPISQPTTAYTSTTTLLAITAPNGTSVSSLTDGTQTVTLSTALDARTVPSGGWATWGAPPFTETATPRVLSHYTTLTSETLTLAVPAATFGLEIEPQTFSTYTISATYYAGATNLGSVSQSVSGSAGARLLAASSSTPITHVVLDVPSGAAGFAIAQVRYGTGAAAVPALGTAGMLGLGLLLAAAGSLLLLNREA